MTICCSKVRLSLVFATVAAVSVGALQLRHDTGRYAMAAGTPEPMLAKDKATWEKLVSEDQLNEMVKNQVDEISKAMKSKGLFTRGRKKAEVNGFVIAALGNIGVVRLEGDAAKKAATLREAGLALAKASDDRDFDGAKKAYEIISGYPTKIEPAASAEPQDFTDIISSHELMEKVSAVDSGVGKANRASSRDFRKEAKYFQSEAMLMAYLAVIERDHNDAADWQKWCDQMRDDSIKLSEAFAAGNVEDTKKAHDSLQESCNLCHTEYRSE